MIGVCMLLGLDMVVLVENVDIFVSEEGCLICIVLKVLVKLG